MTFKLLAVGDLHLGRRSSRLPDGLAANAAGLGPAGAWRRVVDYALEAPVHALLMAGDVVEHEDDFFEGYRELEAGVRRLVEAGIRVLGVAGNHDVQVLPRLADQLPGFELLGRGGQWQVATLEAAGERLRVWGWSFPERQVRYSPLAGQRFERGEGVNLGLLHGDRDQAGSPYAPFSSRELAATGLDGWLLGHIHAPDALQLPGPQGYLGSVTGMDPGEPGDHGPWLLSLQHGRIAAIEQQVLAPLRWQPLTLELDGLDAPQQARERLLALLRDLDTRLVQCARPPLAAGLRLTLTGRSRLAGAVADLLEGSRGEALWQGRGGTEYFIEGLRLEALPEIDLATLAGRSDPPGLLARRLLLLQRPRDDAERRALIESARERFRHSLRDSRWQLLAEDDPLDDEAVAQRLREAGLRLLEQLQAQIDGGEVHA